MNLSIDNIGGSRAKNISVDISYPDRINVSNTSLIFNEILKNTSSYENILISIEKSTSPGIYIINITANWTNLDNSTNSTIGNITVNVTKNPKIITNSIIHMAEIR